MQYHSLSLLEHGYRTTLLGYAGTDVIPQLLPYVQTQQLRIVRMVAPGRFEWVGFRSLRLVLRLLALVWALVCAMFDVVVGGAAGGGGGFGGLFRMWFSSSCSSDGVDVVLVQNPPSAPTLLISWLFCVLHGSSLVIDWHNLGFAMFDLPSEHPVVVVARLYERWIGPLADAHFCVSAAMKEWLVKNFKLSNVHVVRDRPPSFFREANVEEQHECLTRLNGAFNDCINKFGLNSLIEENEDCECSIKTMRRRNEGALLRQDRPVILVSATSWTPDEDFSILIGALIRLDKLLRARNEEGGSCKNILCIVTGKGPLKEEYERKFLQLNPTLRYVHFMTIWLSPSDYPTIIGSADIGVSLHTSTSGIDLPMKILDFFGGGLPVCAKKFDCISELVHHNENGLVFQDSKQLSEQLDNLILNPEKLAKLKKNVRNMSRWSENWDKNAAAVIRSTAVSTSYLMPMIKRISLVIFCFSVLFFQKHLVR